MTRPSEEDFVNEGLTDDERASLSAEPQQEPAPQIEEPIQQQTDQPPAPEEPKMVDIRAVQEARAEARAAREEAARIRDERIRLEERLNVLNQAIVAQQKPQEQAKPVPSRDEDPLGFYEHKLETLEQQLARVNETEQQRTKAIEAEQQFNALTSRAGAMLEQAAAVNPQVNEALDFAFDGLRQEIRQVVAQNNVPPHLQAQEAERLWRSSMATMAQRLPADPQAAADFVFRNARYYGWGYQAPQQPAQVQQNRPNPQELAARQERHMSLSNIQGGEAPQALTLESISKMSEDEFNALNRKLGDKGMDRLFGAA